MIIYDSKKWGSLFRTIVKTFKTSYNLQSLMKFLVFITCYVSLVTYLTITYLQDDSYKIEPVFFSLLGVILSLFLVFRLNSAYDRWWEGRKMWGKLVNDARTLALNLDSIIPPEDRKRRKFFVINIANFCIALQWHLRDNIDLGRMIYLNRIYTEDLEKVKHVPNKIVAFMYNELENMQKENQLDSFDKLNIKTVLQGFTDLQGACERIKNTPIPFSHSTFIKIFIMIYIFILPFGLVHSFGYLAIPAVVIMAFAMVGIELISEEIENPFGLEANSLPTGHLSDVIRENVYEILHVKSNFVMDNRSKIEAEVLH
jgi:ion channel-forming bestrophin family protein